MGSNYLMSYNTTALDPFYQQLNLSVDSDLEVLESKIEGIIMKQEDGWVCRMCGKLSKHKNDLKNHIEGKHITGMAHPCNTCGKTYRSRNSLKSHKTQSHRT